MALPSSPPTEWLLGDEAAALQEAVAESERLFAEIDRELAPLPVRGSLADRVRGVVALVEERERERDRWARAYRQLLRDIATEKDPPDWAELMLDELMELGGGEFLRRLETERR